MDNHHGENVKMYNPDGRRLDFLLGSSYPSVSVLGVQHECEKIAG